MRTATRQKVKKGLASFFAFAALAATQLGASCVDGVTPDCSDAAQCGTKFDAAGDTSILVPDAADAGSADSASDVEAGNPGDAADGG